MRIKLQTALISKSTIGSTEKYQNCIIFQEDILLCLLQNRQNKRDNTNFIAGEVSIRISRMELLPTKKHANCISAALQFLCALALELA